MKLLNYFIPFLLALLTLTLTLILVKMVKRIINEILKKSSQETTKFNFLKHFISGLIYLFGVAIALSFIPSLKSISRSIFAGSGIMAVVIGFASQQALSNIVSGIFIAIFEPFSIGDRISLLGKTPLGTVEDITLRHTVIRTYENKRIIIPNSTISNEFIENIDITEEKVCKYFEIGISYDSDVDRAMKIIEEEIMGHKDYYDNRSESDKAEGVPPVSVRVIGYGESSVNLKAWIWAKDNAIGVKYLWDMNYSVKKRFDAEDIEIPFPYRTIVMKK